MMKHCVQQPWCGWLHWLYRNKFSASLGLAAALFASAVGAGHLSGASLMLANAAIADDQAVSNGLQILSVPETPAWLLNVDIGPELSLRKGPAATGLSTNDFWNGFNAPFQTFASVTNLPLADRTATRIGLTIQDMPGYWSFTGNGTAIDDPMYDTYGYNHPGNSGPVMTFYNLPAGQYDVYLYGHGPVPDQNSQFELLSGTNSYGFKATTSGAGWENLLWADGKQYVRFSRITVSNQPVTIKVLAGNSGYSIVNGLQIRTAGSAPPPIEDGIPAAWRERYFGPDYLSDSRAAANADPDNDGAVNYREYLDGTHPLDQNSVCRTPLSLSTYAGSTKGTNEGFRTEAQFNDFGDFIYDHLGRLWIPESDGFDYDQPGPGYHRIRIMATNGAVSTLTGAKAGLANGSLANARFSGPFGVVFDSRHNAFVLDAYNHLIRKIDTNGMVSTFAGGTRGYQDGLGAAAQFSLPHGLAIDAHDNLFVADWFNLRIRKITPAGEVTTFSGRERGAQDGHRLQATYDGPVALAIDRAGIIYVSDWANGRIRKIDTSGMVSTFVSELGYVEQVSVDSDDNVYFYSASQRTLYKFAPSGEKRWSFTAPEGYQDGPVENARFGGRLTRVLRRPDGNLLVGDDARIRLLSVGPAPLVEIRPTSQEFTNTLQATLQTVVTNGSIRYTLDGSIPTAASPLYLEPVTLTQTTTIKARVFVHDLPVSEVGAGVFTRQAGKAVEIINQPQSQSVLPGTRVSLSVTATGTPPLIYQWIFQGAVVSDATNATLVIAPVKVQDFGEYRVEVRNSLGKISSQPALLKNVLTDGFVLCQLPEGYLPGQPLKVTLTATPPAGATVYAVEDQPPTDWKVEGISHDGSLDPVRTLVKFGPFFDGNTRKLTYQVTPPNNTTGTKRFTGEASVDGWSTPVAGDRFLLHGLRHPSDLNPGDQRITIGEMTTYSAAWKLGRTWSVAPNPIPITYMTRAAYLWRLGEAYAFDPGISAAPLWWVPAFGLQLLVTKSGKPPTSAKAAGISVGGQAVATMTPIGEPGKPVEVAIAVLPSAESTVYAVEDQLPSGWTIADMGEDGFFDTANLKVKWGPFFDGKSRTFHYQAVPPNAKIPSIRFRGLASFDGCEVIIDGQRQARFQEEAQPRLGVVAGALSPSGVQLNLSGDIGAVNAIEFSENLKHWQPLALVTNRHGSVEIADPGAKTRAATFYRIRPE